MNSVLLRCATCAIVNADADEISPMMQATLSRSIMRSALLEAVCGLTESLLQQFDLAAHHAAARIDFLDREVDSHHAVFTERTEKARSRREVTDPDHVGVWASSNDGADRPDTSAAPALPFSRTRRVNPPWFDIGNSSLVRMAAFCSALSGGRPARFSRADGLP